MLEEKVVTLKTDLGTAILRASDTFAEQLQPTMITNIADEYIILEDTEENVKKFENFIEWSKDNVSDKKNPFLKSKVYYNSPDEFAKILEGIHLRAELTAKRKQEELIASPPIDEDIKKISSLKELVEYLIKERKYNESALMTDELDEAILETEQKELQRLADLFLEGE